VKLAVAPERVPILAGIPPGAVIPAWVAHGDGRLAAPSDEIARIERDGHCAFVYCDRDGNPVPAPNGSALDCAALVNRAGNVLAIMPHPERDAWTFNHIDDSRGAISNDARAALAPSGGIRLFEHFARALRGGVPA
jgi:phosphoribosylformylglycinamidine (FGAM) synthase-like amidotransferase family enzyme